MSEREIEATASDIAAETGCSEYVAQMAVRTRVGALIRSDAPVLPDAVHLQYGQSPLVRAAARAAAAIRAVAMEPYPRRDSDVVRQIVQPVPQPEVPQSFERPKRRIVLG